MFPSASGSKMKGKVWQKFAAKAWPAIEATQASGSAMPDITKLFSATLDKNHPIRRVGFQGDRVHFTMNRPCRFSVR